MKKIASALLCIALSGLFSIEALAQSSTLSAGPLTSGHALQYSAGAPLAVLRDGGGSGGGTIGTTLGEIGVTSRSSTNTYPSTSSGNGPNREHLCLYDAPTLNNPNGFHYVCLDPNANGGGLLSFGAGGGASQIPFVINQNGTPLQFPITRQSLGAASSGANGDITSLNGLTTPLPLNEGGVGATTASGGRANLSAAESGANSDITSVDAAVFSGANNILVAGTNGIGIRDSGLQLLKTFVGTVPPGVHEDSTQGYAVGSSGVNTSNGTIWVAQSVAPAAALWVLTSVPGLQTYASASDPGAATDGVHGYAVGSMAINTATGRTFMAKSVATNAAVWVANGTPIVAPYNPNWYVARGQSPAAVSSAVGSTTTIVLSPFFIGQTQTINGLGTQITTGGSSNLQIAVYASDPVTQLPTGTALVNTADIPDTPANNASAIANPTQLPTGMYWGAIEVNDVTAAFLGPNSGVVAEYVGNSIAANIATSTVTVNCITAPTSAYGTWPDLTSATFTFLATTSKCGITKIRIVSVP